MLLALDTSTRLAGVALYDGERGVVVELNWHSANQHTVELMPHVSYLLTQANITAADLTAVAVALGPGSFTGVRVAVATAKGLALARGLKLLGVPTLDAVAYPHLNQPLPVIALVQAGRGRVCWARYDSGTHSAYRLSGMTALAEAITEPTLFAGELVPPTRAVLTDHLAGQATFLPPALAMRRAGYLAEMAWARLIAGEADDLESLRPIYLQEPLSGTKR